MDNVGHLDIYSDGTNYRLVGTVLVDGTDHAVDYNAPSFMVSALLAAAIREGAAS